MPKCKICSQEAELKNVPTIDGRKKLCEKCETTIKTGTYTCSECKIIYPYDHYKSTAGSRLQTVCIYCEQVRCSGGIDCLRCKECDISKKITEYVIDKKKILTNKCRLCNEQTNSLERKKSGPKKSLKKYGVTPSISNISKCEIIPDMTDKIIELSKLETDYFKRKISQLTSDNGHFANITITHTDLGVIYSTQNKKCWYCKNDMEIHGSAISLLIRNNNYVKENVLLSCKSCFLENSNSSGIFEKLKEQSGDKYENVLDLVLHVLDPSKIFETNIGNIDEIIEKSIFKDFPGKFDKQLKIEIKE